MKYRGFSLIELMIVVSVIGIAGGIALFMMSDQIADAWAKSEALALLQEVRAEHRSAKEQMRGLRIKSQAGATNKVIFQGTKNGDCDTDVGPAKEVEFKLARLDLSTPRACFNDRGELDTEASNLGGVTVISSPSLPSALPAAPTVRMAISSGGRPERTVSRPLRIDRSTINHETLIYRGSNGDPATAKANLSYVAAPDLAPVSTDQIGGT